MTEGRGGASLPGGMGTPTKFLVCLALLMAADARAQDKPVPAIGCPSDGQMGPQPAPKSGTAHFPIGAGAAALLAYYHGSETGLLAPRGWHCLELLGSDGSFLLITPTALKSQDVLNHRGTITGPAIQLSALLGETSGRFQVAPIAARIFPQSREFVTGVSAELKDMGMASKFPTGPWPADHMTRLRPDTVEYTTPAGETGLGTQSWLKKGDLPITGVAIFEGKDEPNLTLVSVRLLPAAAWLAPAILQKVEADYGKHP